MPERRGEGCDALAATVPWRVAAGPGPHRPATCGAVVPSHGGRGPGFPAALAYGRAGQRPSTAVSSRSRWRRVPVPPRVPSAALPTWVRVCCGCGPDGSAGTELDSEKRVCGPRDVTAARGDWDEGGRWLTAVHIPMG